jgi:hypothetical protein
MTLYRQKDLDKLMKFFQNEGNSNLTIAINGGWGSGKSYLIDQLIKEINQDKKEIIAIKINLANYSYVNDPLIPFILEVINNKNISKDEKNNNIINNLKKLLPILYIGTSFIYQELTEFIKPITRYIYENKREDELSKSNRIDNNLVTYQSYQTKLGNFVEAIVNLNKRVIIYIDEIERVDPKYTFHVLNLIHQLKKTFIEYITNNKNVNLHMLQFCLVMNRDSLEKQLSHQYGKLHTNENYLAKFIDVEFCLNLEYNFNFEEFLNCDYQKNPNTKIFLETLFNELSIRQKLEFKKLHEKLQNIGQIDKFTNAFFDEAILDHSDMGKRFILWIILTCYIKYKLEINSFILGFSSNIDIKSYLVQIHKKSCKEMLFVDDETIDELLNPLDLVDKLLDASRLEIISNFFKLNGDEIPSNLPENIINLFKIIKEIDFMPDS